MLTPGVIDSSARHVYENGHCLSLAVALAQRLGTNQVLTAAYWPEGDFDEDGEPEDFVRVVHMWACGPDGRVWDINGPRSRTSIDDTYDARRAIEMGGEVFVQSASEAREEFEEYFVPQDYRMANTFAHAVLDNWPEPAGR